MPHPFPASCTSFDGHRRIAHGPLLANVLAVRQAAEAGAAGPLLVFDDATGGVVDVDPRGSADELAARFPPPTVGSSGRDEHVDEAPRGPGRPKLGVVAREVTLLPRHWDWLAAQPGGASVALRKLVEQARRENAERDRLRQAQERAWRFMSAMAGDFPGCEEASRALFANERGRFEALIADWPADVREHVLWLAFNEAAGAEG